MQTAHATGTLLEVRGEQWRVTRLERCGTCTVLTLEGGERANARTRLRVLEPFDRPRPLATGRLKRRARRTVLEAALLATASCRAAGSLWTAAGASIELWPYQLEPALAAIGGAARILLADAVGLGKTVQAGLLLAELQERGWVEHALIVCPAGLRDTWAHELRERFGVTATVLDQPAIAERVSTLPPGMNPWAGHAVAIASIDFVKRPEVLAAIAREPIDLLIADEAHHLAPGTDRGRAVSLLAGRAPWCVLVSATPHSGDSAAFAYLCDIGSTGEPLVVFRRTRRDAGLSESRHVRFLVVSPDADESALLEGVDHYSRAIWNARGQDDRAVRLVAISLARRAASSPVAVEHSLARRLALLSTTPNEPTQAQLPWDEEDAADDVDADEILGSAGLSNAAEEHDALERLIALAQRVGTSSKFERLERLLNRIKEPALIFTEYRDTLETLASRLSPSRAVGVIHGGLSRVERQQVVDAFNGGRIDVLIATDAAGEGLNLHHRCRLVIDIELPWSPLRLEQRVGRVDRLGQQRTVHAIRLFHPCSIESRVLEHLQLRRQRADAAMDAGINDGDVARAIFEGGTITTGPGAPMRSDRIATAADEAERATRQRLIQERHAARANRCWSTSRRPRSLAFVHRRSITNVAGFPIEESVASHRVQLRSIPPNRREWRRLIERADAAIRSLPIESDLESPPCSQVERRISALRERLSRQLPREHQRSLFDGRAEADAQAQASVIASLDASLARTLAAVASPVDRASARVELIAAWSEYYR